jgi:hypothetical protein
MWLKRALEFINAFITAIVEGEESLTEAATAAYGGLYPKCLASHFILT